MTNKMLYEYSKEDLVKVLDGVCVQPNDTDFENGLQIMDWAFQSCSSANRELVKTCICFFCHYIPIIIIVLPFYLTVGSRCSSSSAASPIR
jgi:t-SNARE complex subunit (syntaxin)